MLQSDFSPFTEICPGCGSRFPVADSARHEYLSASAGCWSVFGRILERQFSDFRYAPAHQLFADAYCVQHSTSGEPQARRSAMVHLAALYAQVELGRSDTQAILLRQRLSNCLPEAPFGFRRATGLSPETVSLASPDAHRRTVDVYAVSVFAALSDQHDLAARLCRLAPASANGRG